MKVKNHSVNATLLGIFEQIIDDTVISKTVNTNNNNKYFFI